MDMIKYDPACTRLHHGVLAWHRHSWQAEEAAGQQSRPSQHQLEQYVDASRQNRLQMQWVTAHAEK